MRCSTKHKKFCLLNCTVKILILAALFLCLQNAFARPVKRIIVLAPNLAELVSAAGAGKNLVGVSSSTPTFPNLKKLPIVAEPSSINFEKIIALKPDLVIAWQGGTPIQAIEKLRQLGIKTEIASFKKISDIPRNIVQIGRLAGTSKTAKQFAIKFMARYRALRLRYSHKKPVKVFYALSQEPLMTLNKRSSVSEAIKVCGGRNIFADALTIAPEINIESILLKNPDVILIGPQMPSSQKTIWQKYPELTAVKKKQIYRVPDNLERYSPQILDSIETICRQIDEARKSD